MNSRLRSEFLQPPLRRPLKIFASDPMMGRAVGNRISIEIANEKLRPGPCGTRIEVIDYDGVRNCYYEPVDLDHVDILIQGGLDPTESDPRFHQQMVYAVATRVLENFDRALGRRLNLKRKGHPLRIYPHAFHGAKPSFSTSPIRSS